MKTIVILGTLLICSLLSYGQVNMSQGLQLYLPFNGNAQDASGNGNNGIVNGATLTTDQNNNPNSAYLFNGTSDHISIPNSTSLNPAGPMTICVKVKMQGFYNGFCYNNVILSKGSDLSTSSTSHYSIRTTQTLSGSCSFQDTTNHNYRFDLNGNGNATSSTINTAINNAPYVQLNQWDCIVGIFDGIGSTSKVYVNGVLRYSLPVSSKPANSDELTIGYSSTSSLYPFWFKGIIDEVRLYNRAININEINYYCTNQFPESTKDFILKKNIAIYPNPASSTFVIESKAPSQKVAAYSIQNIQGKVVEERTSLRSSKEVINIENYHKGLYLIKVVGMNGSSFTEKIVIE